MAVYLDNAATSFPKPPRVYEQLRGYLEKYGACPGRGSYEMARDSEAVVEETRKLLGGLFNIGEPERIAFTLNATDALNMAIKGVLEPGDHVVTTELEHNSVSRPLNALEKKGVIRLTRVSASEEGVINPKEIERAICDQTKLICVIHGSNVIGSLQPIDEIGGIVRKRGALFLVDAAQTAGAAPIDVESCCIDLLAFPGHKTLLGPPGTGGLYVGARASVSAWREGGTGVFSELAFQPEDFPYRLEAGSPNTLGLAGLRESVGFILQYGVEWIRSHKLALVERLISGLRNDERIKIYGPSSFERRVAVVSANIPGCKPEKIGQFLEKNYRISVRTGLHCAPGVHRLIGTFPEGTVRISPGYFTKESEIDLCLEALREAADQLSCVKNTQPSLT